MSEEKQQLSEYQIRELTGRLSYVSSAQCDLVDAALRVLQEKKRGLARDDVRETLRDLANAGLISSGVADSVVKKLFE